MCIRDRYFADIAFRTGGSSNYGGYSNAEVDKLIEELDVEFDSERRTELAKEIQQKIIDDAGYKMCIRDRLKPLPYIIAP